MYGQAEGPPIKPAAGAPQGGPLSPIIFIVVQDLIATHLNLHGKSLGFQINDLNNNICVSNMIIVDDVTMTAGSFQNAQTLLHLAAEINIACGIRGNSSKTLVSHSPAAYRKSSTTNLEGAHLKPTYVMSQLTERMTILNNVPIPDKGILAPQDEFRMLGVFLRFMANTNDALIPHSPFPNKWTLVYEAAKNLTNKVVWHLKHRKSTIEEAKILIQSVLISSLTYRCMSTGSVIQCRY